MASGRCVGQRPDGHTFLCKFCDIFKLLYLAYFWVYLHQTWGFCKACAALYDYVDQ